MSDISELRSRIDAIDAELLRLLNERAALAQQIGTLKNREGLPVYSPEREVKLLRSLAEKSEGPLRPESLRAIYREIMSASLALEKDTCIACLGPMGSPTYQAAREKFGSSVRYLAISDVAGVFKSVRAGDADCGVVPLETHEHGLENATLDALADTDLNVCAVIVLPGEDSEDRREASRLLVLGRGPNPPSGHDCTLLVLRVENKPGALVSSLEPFKAHEINLFHFAARPASKGSSDIFFFVEAEGHSRDLQVGDVLRDLSKKCRAVKVLGSYPKPIIQ